VPTRRLLVLVAAVSVVLVVAVGASRSTYEVGGQEVTCPERVWSSALQSLTDRAPGPCAAAAQSRLFAVTASLMGLVLISGLLSRRR
jgi:hypothetical protein